MLTKKEDFDGNEKKYREKCWQVGQNKKLTYFSSRLTITNFKSEFQDVSIGL